MVLVGGVGVKTLVLEPDWGDDWAQYLDQRDWLLAGNRQEPVHRFVYQTPCAMYAPPLYPWGWPLLLAATSDLSPAVVVSLFWGLGAVLLWGLLRDVGHSLVSSVLWTLVWFFSPWMIRFKAEWLSDLPFAVAVWLTFWVWGRISRGSFWAVAAVISLALALLLRPLGWAALIALLAGMVWEYFQTRTLPRARGGVVAGALVLTGTVGMILPSPSGHFSAVYLHPMQPEPILDRILYYAGMWRYVWGIPTGSSFGWSYVLGGLVWLVALSALFVHLLLWASRQSKLFRSSEGDGVSGILEQGPTNSIPPHHVFVLFSLLYLGAVLLFPNETQGFRYLIPLIPLLTPKINSEGWSRTLALLVLLGFTAPWSRMADGALLNPPSVGPNSKKALECYDALVRLVPESDTVACSKPRVVARNTGRWTQFRGNASGTVCDETLPRWIVTSVHWPEVSVPSGYERVWSNGAFALFSNETHSYLNVH